MAPAVMIVRRVISIASSCVLIEEAALRKLEHSVPTTEAAFSFDDLAGEREKRQRDREAEHLHGRPQLRPRLQWVRNVARPHLMDQCFPQPVSVLAGTGLLKLFHYLIEGEAAGLLPGRGLLVRGKVLAHEGLRRDERKH